MNQPQNWKLLIGESQVNEIIESLALKIKVAFKGMNFVIVPVMMGASYLCTDLSRALGRMNVHHVYHSISSSSYDGQVQTESKILLGDINKFKDLDVLIFDELFDTGKTFHEIKEILIKEHQFNAESIHTCAAFIKNKPEFKYDLPDIHGIYIPDVWVVGCGLDDNGYYRYLNSLYATPKIEELKHLCSKEDLMFEDENYYKSFFEGNKFVYTV